MGAKDDDAKVLSYGYAFEQLTNERAEPQYYTNAEDLPDIAVAMRGQKRE
jgi:amidase